MITGLRFFYRHIHVTGLENVPGKGPVIIIANHASSVMDAAVLGILLKRPIHFFARGDVFVNKPVQKILSWLHMMPVHNHDGRHTLHANTNSFSEAQHILTKGGIIVFFPESTSHIERQLWPFRKGVFRLAFQTAMANDFLPDISIVPVGITYDHPTATRTDVQVHVGEPILLSAYKTSYLSNAPATLLQISKHAYDRAFKKILHVKDKDRLPVAEQCLILCRNNQANSHSPWKINSASQLELEQAICAWINSASRDKMKKTAQHQSAYFDMLDRYELRDKAIASSFLLPPWKKMIVWIGFPLYITGIILNGLPVLIAKKIADKKVTRIDFYSWIYVACCIILYCSWFLIAGIITGLTAGWKFVPVVLPAMLLSGLFTYYYIDWLRDYRAHQKLNRLSPLQKTMLKKMRAAAQVLQ